MVLSLSGGSAQRMQLLALGTREPQTAHLASAPSWLPATTRDWWAMSVQTLTREPWCQSAIFVKEICVLELEYKSGRKTEETHNLIGHDRGVRTFPVRKGLASWSRDNQWMPIWSSWQLESQEQLPCLGNPHRHCPLTLYPCTPTLLGEEGE